ncbi:hypothetical protein H5410_030048 [Solanum commersonii]|uniref:Endonuclease/exonuclease/phosphatase domain-containing protein n=1 Tax=Solanum commersonii TaxID=4109 RepID=A0A9J5YI54_SOLCO|nr:hypothetical protein H5410_030048 [Solanum commersonii]
MISKTRPSCAKVKVLVDLLIFWENTWEGTLVESSHQHIFINFKQEGGQIEVIITTIFAKCDDNMREELWDTLQHIAANNKPWLVGGYFNVILTQEKKLGGLPICNREISAFAQCIASCDFLALFPTNEVTHLVKQGSDHAALHLKCNVTE